MTRPKTYLIRMLVFLVAVAAIAAWLAPTLRTIFLNNPDLNGLILFILLFGIVWTLRQVTRLGREVAWLEAYQNPRPRATAVPAPRLLAPMASMLTMRDAGRGPKSGAQARFTLSTLATRSLLDSIGSRLDESREVARYMTGLLIFLGLLGTFWGLLRTVGAVSGVIQHMSIASSDLSQLFEQLKSGLAEPLNGMGIAFSASMFGLSSALVLGFLDLTAAQAQNRFFNELEEWLAGLTRLSSGIIEGEGSVPVYVQALLEQAAENMESLQHILARGEETRAQASQTVLALAERMAALTDTMRANQQLMLRIGEAQQSVAPVLQRLVDMRNDAGLDEISRAHLRNIDLHLQRLLTESEQGRLQTIAELRSDLRILTRTIAARSEAARLEERG
ncbi:MAG TPA: flagellar motor protein MotA [Acetobacteraceae bacterium]|nr:flagellar motor protein MotA [Acetobacteraceae bacterium]